MYSIAPRLLVNNYQNINETVRNINRGGCGIFAEKLYNILLKFGNKPKLLVITTDAEGLKTRISGETSMGGALEHIVVQVGKYYYDSQGRYTNHLKIGTYGKTDLVELPLDVLVKWNAQSWRWNDCFNRRSIKTIETKLNNVYKKVVNHLEKSI